VWMTRRAISARPDVEVLRWAQELGCPWDADEMCADAAAGGNRGDFAVRAGARLPMARGYLSTRRSGRAPGGAAVGAGEPLPMG